MTLKCATAGSDYVGVTGAPNTLSFTAGGGLSPTSFQLDDDANGTLSNTRTFADVPAGAEPSAEVKGLRGDLSDPSAPMLQDFVPRDLDHVRLLGRVFID